MKKAIHQLLCFCWRDLLCIVVRIDFTSDLWSLAIHRPTEQKGRVGDFRWLDPNYQLWSGIEEIASGPSPWIWGSIAWWYSNEWPDLSLVYSIQKRREMLSLSFCPWLHFESSRFYQPNKQWNPIMSWSDPASRVCIGDKYHTLPAFEFNGNLTPDVPTCTSLTILRVIPATDILF